MLTCRRRIALVIAVVVGTSVAAGAQTVAPTEAPSKDAIRRFLTSAPILSHKDIPKGTTRPTRLTLSDGTLTHDAAFSTVDEHVAIMRFQSGRTELDFV